MGFFGDFVYSQGSWTEVDADAGVPSGSGIWLSVSIHDSDFTTIRYFPTCGGRGEAFLGFTPRIYFEEPSASAPTDAALEAAGLVSWTRVAETGASPPVEVVESFLATDDEAELDEDSDLSDDEIFAELKTAEFIEVLGLPELPLGS